MWIGSVDVVVCVCIVETGGKGRRKEKKTYKKAERRLAAILGMYETSPVAVVAFGFDDDQMVQCDACHWRSGFHTTTSVKDL